MFDAFVKIHSIDGECTDEKHNGWIEALCYDFSVAQKVSKKASSTGGASEERADFSEFTFSKLLDATSPMLALACAEGRHLNEIMVELYRAGKVNFMTYKMTDCLISKLSTASNGEFPEEEIAVNFSRLELAYTQQERSKGSATGIVISGWDRARNSKV